MLSSTTTALTIFLALSTYLATRTLRPPPPPLLHTMDAPTLAPVYFISHGGPPTMFEQHHPAYRHWRKWGQEVRSLHEKGIIRGLVFVSAHWQADDLDQGVYVGVDETNPLVYDFYGFPDYFYKQKVDSNNPNNVSGQIMHHLGANGVSVVASRRGIDHGVWCPLKVAFQPSLAEMLDGDDAQKSSRGDGVSVLPKTLSLTQVSLPRAEAFLDSVRLGVALRGLREAGFAVVGGGMAVHNLSDFMRFFTLGGGGGGGLGLMRLRSTRYSKSFLQALTAAMTVKAMAMGRDEERWALALGLERRTDYLEAHPTPEHLLPALVALGASRADEQGVETFAFDEGPMGWNMYKWG